MWGVQGRALSHPRLPAPWAGCRGPLPTGCGCGGVQAWGPVTSPTARSLASWLCALWGRHKGARGDASCLGVGRLVLGALPTPTARPFGGLPGPTTHWLWVWGVAGAGTRHQPHSALLRAGFARCGGGMSDPGGAPLAWVLGVRGRAHSHPRLPALWAGCRGPLPTGCGCGGMQAWGPVTNPTACAPAGWLCALWGGTRAPGGGASCLGVEHRGRALSHPRLPAPWAGCRGQLPTGCGCRGARAWGAVTNPTARALASWLCALWGRNEGARGGRLLPGCGASRVGRSPNPDCPPSGRAAGAHYPLAVGAGGAGVGTRHQPHSARSCELALRAMGAAPRAPRGGRLLPGCGASGVGRSPIPDCPPSGWAAGAHYPLAVGAGGCGRGDPPPTPQRALLRAGFARCGDGMRVPGGAPLSWVWDVRCRALSHPRLPALWADCRGPLPTGCGSGGVRA